jgi:hypothetical protein
MSRASVSDRPKTISCRRLMGLASFATHLTVGQSQQHAEGNCNTVLTRRGQRLASMGVHCEHIVMVQELYSSQFGQPWYVVAGRSES